MAASLRIKSCEASLDSLARTPVGVVLYLPVLDGHLDSGRALQLALPHVQHLGTMKFQHFIVELKGSSRVDLLFFGAFDSPLL